MKEIKTVALIAHDNKKAEMVAWSMKNKDLLAKYQLCGTGTTSKLVAESTGLDVYRYLSGPLGGDQQIGAKIAEGQIDVVIFFWDPLSMQPHDPDVKALLTRSRVPRSTTSPSRPTRRQPTLCCRRR